MKPEMITITKKPGIKACVRISKKEDIPVFLKDVVKIEGDKLVLDCLEGEEIVPVGSVIAYEKLETGKMNVWNKANYKETTMEVDGVFYDLPKPNTAIRADFLLPAYASQMLGDKFKELEDGTFQIEVEWGLVTCKPDNGYLVIYGKKEDGSLDVNFLTKDTPSFEQYFVLDENGQIVQSLAEYEKAYHPDIIKR